MLYGLCSLQTNLHISFHHKFDVLLHQGTTLEELLFIIRNQKCHGKNSAKGTSELRSTRPNFIPFLVTRCLHEGGVHLTCRSAWPKGWPNVKLTWAASTSQPDLTQFWSWPWDASIGVHLSWVCLTANVKLTLCSTALGHCMHLWGVHLT